MDRTRAGSVTAAATESASLSRGSSGWLISSVPLQEGHPPPQAQADFLWIQNGGIDSAGYGGAALERAWRESLAKVADCFAAATTAGPVPGNPCGPGGA